MAVNEVEVYKYKNLGCMIDPKSDTKVVFIPSPPTKLETKVNPRPVVIYITGGKVTENCENLGALKQHCDENKVVFACPESTEIEEIGETYTYIMENAKKLNLQADNISVKSDEENYNVACEALDYLIDELDAEFENEEVEKFEIK